MAAAPTVVPIGIRRPHSPFGDALPGKGGGFPTGRLGGPQAQPLGASVLDAFTQAAQQVAQGNVQGAVKAVQQAGAGAQQAITTAQQVASNPAAAVVQLGPQVIEWVEVRTRWSPPMRFRVADLLQPFVQGTSAPPPPGTQAGPTGQDGTAVTGASFLQPTVIFHPGAAGKSVTPNDVIYAPYGVSDTGGASRLFLALLIGAGVAFAAGFFTGRRF